MDLGFGEILYITRHPEILQLHRHSRERKLREGKNKMAVSIGHSRRRRVGCSGQETDRRQKLRCEMLRQEGI